MGAQRSNAADESFKASLSTRNLIASKFSFRNEGQGKSTPGVTAWGTLMNCSPRKLMRIIFKKPLKASGNGPKGKWQMKTHLLKKIYETPVRNSVVDEP